MSYEDKEVNESKEGLNRLDLPPIFDGYGDKEILGFENYCDKGLFDYKEFAEALVLLSFL